MKQKLEPLLQHFDDDGKLLPGNVLMENPAGCWKLSPRTTLGYMLKEITNGVDFRIELTPVAPRGVVMERDDVIKVLTSHNKWRRGDTQNQTYDCKKIGVAIDSAIALLSASPGEREVSKEFVTYELTVNDEYTASASGKGALAEICRYAYRYMEDGEVKIYRVLREEINIQSLIEEATK